MIIISLVLVGGVVYRTYILPASSRPYISGEVKYFKVIAEKDKWRFEPEVLDVQHGDKVILEVVNEDEYDHGIAIDAFGVSQRMPAKSTIKVEFIATQPGDFPFYCSVPCGEGEVDGERRTHFDMIGTVKVRTAIQPIE